jgi:hypothetical protein
MILTGRAVKDFSIAWTMVRERRANCREGGAHGLGNAGLRRGESALACRARHACEAHVDWLMIRASNDSSGW